MSLDNFNVEHGAEEQENQLVFPVNVHESLQSSKGLKVSEKNGIIATVWALVSLAVAWFLGGWLRTLVPQYYFWIVLAVELALQLTVGSFILRLLLDEKAMVREMSNESNSFAKYFGIYHEILAEEGSVYPFDILEFSDGSYCAFVQLLLGYNTDTASAATYNVNHEIIRIINKSGMPYKQHTGPEDFSSSAAADELKAIVSGIAYPELFKAYRETVQGLLSIANEHSNVLCTTFILYARTSIHKEELERVVTDILNLIAADQTVYREAYTMSYDNIVEFLRRYYNLDILDMGLIRVHAAHAKTRVACPVKLLKVYGKSGKIYATNQFERLNREIIEEHGLQQVNNYTVGNGNSDPFES